ncbi:hypothetical protein FB451DRAFT_1553975 [Mycena latifolia]|nr:hypothetical protein FB451DRAFT_1553975 [Mycena latifolia]
MLLSLPYTLFNRGVHEDSDLPIDGTGILHAIWLYRNHPELGTLLEQVEHPTDDNLREAGRLIIQTNINTFNTNKSLLPKMSTSSSTFVSTRAVLSPREAHALLRAHIFHSGDVDRTPCRLPSDSYNHLAYVTGMRRTLRAIPPVAALVPSAPDQHIRHAFRRHSYPACPRRASEPLW